MSDGSSGSSRADFMRQAAAWEAELSSGGGTAPASLPWTDSEPLDETRVAWKVWLLRVVTWIAIFSVGAAAGALAQSWGMHWRMDWSRKNPEEMAQRIAKVIQSDHGLNDDQTQKVAKILFEHHQALDQLSREMDPKFTALRDQMKTEMKEVLTPSQYAAWEERMIRHGPGPGLGRGPFGGPPPGPLPVRDR